MEELKSKEFDYIKVTPKSPPKYINEQLIQQALEAHYDCHVDLLRCRFYCITIPGENFSSEIYRVNVHFTMYNRGVDSILYKPTTHDHSLIVKNLNFSAQRPDGSNELLMHKYILRKLKKMLGEVYPDEYVLKVVGDSERVCKVSASCLFCFCGKYELYVLQDLTRISFCHPNRFDGLNLIEAQYVMKKLAHMHAASMEYLRQYPLVTNTFLPSPIAKGISPSSFLGVATFEGMRYAIDLVKCWPGFESIAESMRSTMENFNERLIEVMQHKNCAFKVILHGEPWAKNIFMKYAHRHSNVSPRDATFVDFQMSFIGSCGYDLNYFLHTSVQFDVLLNHRRQLIQWYYEHLTRTLVKLKYPTKQIPTMSMLLDELFNFEFIGYYAMLVQLPMVCMDEDTVTDFRPDNLFNPVERQCIYNIIYSYERVHNMFRYGLQRFAQFGVI